MEKVLSRGTIRGKVLGESGPVAGANVQVYERKSSLSANDGSYTLLDVGLGGYHLSASATIDGVELSGRTPVSLASAELNVDIHLQAPSDRNRLAQIFLEFWGRDEESFSSDELKHEGPQYFELEVSPDKPVNSLPSTYTTYKWGGEVRVVYSITVWLLPDNTIEVQVKGLLYEGTGTSEKDDDLDGEGIAIFSVGVNQTTGTTFTITNTDENDDDAGTLAISVKNVRNNT